VPTVEYQPIYGDDPLSLKQWIWADYLFAGGSATKTITPCGTVLAAGPPLSLTKRAPATHVRAFPDRRNLSHVLTPAGPVPRVHLKPVSKVSVSSSSPSPVSQRRR